MTRPPGDGASAAGRHALARRGRTVERGIGTRPAAARSGRARHGAGRTSPGHLAILALAVAIAGAGFYALAKYGRSHGPDATPASISAPTTAKAAAQTIGWLDSPTEEAVVGPTVKVVGWALDPAGVRAVEVRLDGKPFPALLGIARPDVAQARPGYPDSAVAGFAFAGDFSAELAGDPAPRHSLTIVAVSRDGRETVLARRSLIAPGSMVRWDALLDARPGLAARKFSFLMMSSGLDAGGAGEIDAVYRPYLSRTMQVGVAVPILYLRTTRGARGDWAFDPDFDLSRKCGNRVVAEDTLHGVIRQAIASKLPVEFILNGGIWADASCDTPEWDLNDHLEQNIDNCQWTQRNEVLPDDYLKNLPGSTQSPELARSLTYNVYATQVRQYKRRNLQAAAAIIARFAREHPELFVGVVLDADTYMNPFVQNGRWYDYNPGMLKQFRHWLRGSGPYAGAGERGTPDLSSYRRARPLSLAAVNRLAKRQWKSWDEVDPPRSFPGEGKAPMPPGALPFWEDAWHLEWDSFRKHVVALHYDELSAWVRETGIPRDRILSAQAFIAPDSGMRPVSLHIRGQSPDYDSAGVSIEGAIPRQGHLGTILYGPAAENHHPLENGRSLFSTLARMDPGWGIVEYNATDLKRADVLPTYSQSYHTFRDLFNFDGRQIAMMAWNGSNGLFAGQPGYVPYTSWRNTPGEDAMRDFLVDHADLPRGARLWTFGTPRHADDDGWSLDHGKLAAGRGFVDLEFDTAAVLASPADQVLRAAEVDTLVLGLSEPAALVRVQVQARTDGASPWRQIAAPVAVTALRRSAAGLQVPLVWPPEWRGTGAIADQLQIVLTFDPGTTHARVHRIALYPREPKRGSLLPGSHRGLLPPPLPCQRRRVGLQRRLAPVASRCAGPCSPARTAKSRPCQGGQIPVG